MRLGGVAQHLHTRLLRGQGHGGEVDVGGDVFAPYLHQRVAIGQVALVAHHRAHVALGVVVLVFAKAVVQQEGRAPLQPVGQHADEAFALGVDFGQVVLRAFDIDRRAQVGRAVGPGKTAVFGHHHAALMPHTALLTAVARQQLHGHGVQHFIAHHHTAKLFGQGIYPAQLVRVGNQLGLLAGPQAARQIDDGVALHPVAQRIQQLQRQRARACAKLPHLIGTGALQGLAHLHGQRLAEQGRELGRGHKVAARLGHGAKFGGVVGVIAQAGRVQRQGHEAVKTQPSALGGNGLGDVLVKGGR